MMDTSEYTRSLDMLDDQVLSYVAMGMADLGVNTSVMLNKETNIAKSVNNVFTTMDRWRKVDPPLPLSLVTMQATDVVLENGQTEGYTNVVISLKNDYTGEVIVSPVIEIYDSYGLINTESIESASLKPGEIKEFTASVLVPHNVLRDSAGYMAIVTFTAAEAETMTIATSSGPYIAYFNANSQNALANIRDSVNAMQPLGGLINVNETKTATILTNAENNSLRILCAGLAEQSDIMFTVRDAQGQIQTTTSLINPNDFVMINGGLSSSYTIEVTNNGDEEQEFSLLAVEAPYNGAIAGIYTENTNIIATSIVDESNTQNLKATIPISIYETGLREDLTDVNISVSDLVLKGSTEIKINSSDIVITNLGDVTKTALPQSFTIGNGTGRRLVVNIYPQDGVIDGEYEGNILINLNANNFDIENSPYPWQQEEDLSYSYQLPVKVKIMNAAPVSPIINSVETNDEAQNMVTVSGYGVRNERVVVYITDDVQQEGVIKAIVVANEEGEYTAEFAVDNEGYHLGSAAWIYSKAVSDSGVFSDATQAHPITIMSYDTTPPEITIITPIPDYVTDSVVDTVIFDVYDAQSRLSESLPIVSINNLVADVLYNNETKHYEARMQNLLPIGNQRVSITAQNEIGLIQVFEYSFNIGSSVDTHITVDDGVNAIENARVIIDNVIVYTDAQGTAVVPLNSGEYGYRVEKEGFIIKEGSAFISAGNNNINISLTKGYMLVFNIETNEIAVADAAIEINGIRIITNAEGNAEILLQNNTYSYTVSKNGYRTIKGSVTINNSDQSVGVTIETNTDASFTVLFTVKDNGGVTVTDADIIFDTTQMYTDLKGQTVFSRQNGSYNYTVS
ncbi:MAG: hypothetical protein GX800_07845 [Clostridiaceae bacterium]|nr:hypothetical protein [Clostridiaceae bacterium]